MVTVPLLQRFTKALVSFPVKFARAFCSGLIYGNGSDQAQELAVVVAEGTRLAQSNHAHEKPKNWPFQ